MELVGTTISGVYLIKNFISQDKRGFFCKTFHSDEFKGFGLRTDFRESYYSTSNQHVIRGMHFQSPPYDHAKLVYVTAGEILDVVVDLRQDSPTFKKHAVFQIQHTGDSVYIPSGFAHGFLTLSKQATVIYNVTTVYAPEADSGIHWNSIGFQWPVTAPIVSERDAQFDNLEAFKSFF